MKQGKLPKNITDINIKDTLYEVTGIMDFQLRIKGIDIRVNLENFGDNFEV